MKNRIGFGYDIHRLARGRPLFLGGVKIPHLAGLAGHSDGDALIHALIDALLGAAGEGDIGRLFPDTEEEFKGIRSTELLKRAMTRLKGRRFEVLHIDSVIVAEAPQLAVHSGRMKETLSPILGLPLNRIGIKAKTNEGLGPVGEKKAVACWAVVLVGEKRRKKAKKKAAVLP